MSRSVSFIRLRVFKYSPIPLQKSDSFDRAAAEAEARKGILCLLCVVPRSFNPPFFLVSPEHPGTNLALLIGGTVAGGVAALALALFVWLRQRRSAARNAPTSHVNSRPSEYGHYRGHAVPPVVSGPLASPGVYVSTCLGITK